MILRALACIGTILLAVACASTADEQSPNMLEASIDGRLVDKLEAVQKAHLSPEIKELAKAAVAKTLQIRLDEVHGAQAELARQRPGAAIESVGFGDFHALVIGNNDYRQLSKLETAVADAKAIADVLAAKYGFRVTLLLDATRYDILSALNDLRLRLTENDNLLIYYSGHSELDEAGTRSYWLPVDAGPDSRENWISAAAITDAVEAMASRRVMILADGAYAGLLTRSALAPLGGDFSISKRLQVMSSRKSRTALASGSLAPVLDAAGGRHSVFARALLDAFHANDDVLEGQELHREIAKRFASGAPAFQFEQKSQYAPMKHAGHEGGEFFLVPKDFDTSGVEQPAQVTERASANHTGEPAADADSFIIVDCVLPGIRRRLGRPNPIYVAPRRATRTTARDCELRGGEYVAYGRSDSATALRIWLPPAQEGDPKAQTYVGELYEKGFDGEPDYQEAAKWYRRAAEQGYAPAQVNLGHLYERGLGVPQSDAEALAWYQRALRYGEGGAAMASAEPNVPGNLSEELLEPEEGGRLRAKLSDLEQRRAALERERRRIEELAALEPASRRQPLSMSSGPVITLIDPKLPEPVTDGVVVRTRMDIDRRPIVGRVDAPAGLLSIVVNERTQSFNEQHVFETEVPLRPNGARVSVVAVDQRGQRADLAFVLWPEERTTEALPVERADGPPMIATRIPELRELAGAVSAEQIRFAQPAFQCLQDLRVCKSHDFPWFDCELTMLVCLFNIVLD